MARSGCDPCESHMGRDHLDDLRTAGLLKERYYRAHQAYDQLFKAVPEEWELPD